MNAFCTVVTPSHLCWAKALAKSLKKSDNDLPLYVLLVSEESYNGLLPDNLHLVSLNQLTRSLPENLCWYFDAFELCNALKPFIVEWVFTQGFDKVAFLDSDLYVVGTLKTVWSALDNAALILTPHHLSPPALCLGYTNEAAVADMGILNGGFMAWRAGDVANQILDWMCIRFPVYGFCDRKQGMFVDQKLLPLVLQYFYNDVSIINSPRLNVAFWNAHERHVTHIDNRYLIDQESVIFFHMSGFRLSQPTDPCSYLPQKENEAILTTAPWMVPLLQEYALLLSTCLDTEFASVRPFTKYNDIQLIPSLRRLLFKKGRLCWRDPDVLKAVLTEKAKKMKRRFLPYRNA